jgi:hypothetical protein
LITQVEATSPYNTNTITLTTNAENRVFSDETENCTSDPVIEYVFLGNDLSDGIFGWINIAVNTSASYESTTPIIASFIPLVGQYLSSWRLRWRRTWGTEWNASLWHGCSDFS